MELRETVSFEVVDHTSAYHAILGRPALAKFMAVPHYAYLKMKLPGPETDNNVGAMSY